MPETYLPHYPKTVSECDPALLERSLKVQIQGAPDSHLPLTLLPGSLRLLGDSRQSRASTAAL